LVDLFFTPKHTEEGVLLKVPHIFGCGHWNRNSTLGFASRTLRGLIVAVFEMFEDGRTHDVNALVTSIIPKLPVR
jgi:hypothetical protein